MCGRVALFTPPARLARYLEATLAAGIDPAGQPSWNVGPMRPLFALLGESPTLLSQLRWGLVPRWATNENFASHTINARGETVAEKPSFREAFSQRPCVIPVDGFYEWQVLPGQRKRAFYFPRSNGEPLLLAGLYEYWRRPHDPTGSLLATCTIVTTEPGPDVDGIHDRMPVVLQPTEVHDWLTRGAEGPVRRSALIRPAPAGTLSPYGVGPRVGNIRHDGPDLLAPQEFDSLF